MPDHVPDSESLRMAHLLAGRLGMAESQDTLLVGDNSVTLLWQVWLQPFYINIVRTSSSTIIRAGCAPLSFADEIDARSFASDHNETTTLWSWYAEAHPSISGAGVWLSFIKLIVEDRTADHDLEFVVAVLRDMVADSFLKFANNLSELHDSGNEDVLVPPPFVPPPRWASDGTVVNPNRYQFTIGFRGAVWEHSERHGNAYAGALSEKVRFIVTQEFCGGSYTPSSTVENALCVEFSEPTPFWADEAPVVLFTTDVTNPAMSAGLLVHVSTDLDFSIENAESANAYERRSTHPVQFLGAWTLDPLGPLSPSGSSVKLSHTAFYPSYYFTHQQAFEIAAKLNKRLGNPAPKRASA